MKRTQIVLLTKKASSEEIDSLPDMTGKNKYSVLVILSKKIQDGESKKFIAEPDIIGQIAQTVSSLRIQPRKQGIIIHCFNDVPDHVALL